MMTQRLVLPLPPSVNAAYRNVATNRRIRTEETRSYFAEAGWIAKQWAQEAGWVVPEPGRKIVVRLWYAWPDRARRDAHNREKVLLDALEGVLYPDDRWVLVQEQDFFVDRERPRVEIEIEPLENPSPRESYRVVLQGWSGLVKQKSRLASQIARQEERLAHLLDRLSPSGILGAFRSVPEVNADRRPSGGHGDKVASLVVEVDAQAEKLNLSLALLRVKLQDVTDELAEIEGDVRALEDDRSRKALTLYFRDEVQRDKICALLYVSRSTLYRDLADGIETMDRLQADRARGTESGRARPETCYNPIMGGRRTRARGGLKPSPPAPTD
jgi:crossover junction endodeoxyribonuclease RusA